MCVQTPLQIVEMYKITQETLYYARVFDSIEYTLA